MTRFYTMLIRVTVLVAIAASLLGPRPLVAGERKWREVSFPSGTDIASPVTHTRIATGPVRVYRTSASFKPGSRGRYNLDSVGITNETTCVAHRIWLFWRLYRESDLEKPAFESIDIPTTLLDVDRDISPSLQVKWVFSSDHDGSLLLEQGVTYRLEFGVSRVEWSDGSVWLLGQPDRCPTRGAT